MNSSVLPVKFVELIDIVVTQLLEKNPEERLSSHEFFWDYLIPWRYRIDETDLMEILGNLLDNACKACNQRVKISAFGKPLQLDIEDDGPGIPHDKREELFQRGTRLDTYKEGHGVGLSIVSELVKSYSGELQVSQSPLGGARFVIRFPESGSK